MDQVWTVVLAAGSGSRFGPRPSGGSGADEELRDPRPPKQYEELGDRRVLDWSLEAARSVSDGIVLVVQADRAGDAEPGADQVVAGGDTRSDSVRCGLAAVPEDAGVIVVHDSARPLASASLFASVVEAVRSGAAGAVPVVPVADTIKRVSGGEVIQTLDREELVAAQTPQAFRAAVLRSAHAGPGGAGAPQATDDAALVELLGETVAVVPGEAANLKITLADDLDRARQLARST